MDCLLFVPSQFCRWYFDESVHIYRVGWLIRIRKNWNMPRPPKECKYFFKKTVMEVQKSRATTEDNSDETYIPELQGGFQGVVGTKSGANVGTNAGRLEVRTEDVGEDWGRVKAESVISPKRSQQLLFRRSPRKVLTDLNGKYLVGCGNCKYFKRGQIASSAGEGKTANQGIPTLNFARPRIPNKPQIPDQSVQPTLRSQTQRICDKSGNYPGWEDSPNPFQNLVEHVRITAISNTQKEDRFKTNSTQNMKVFSVGRNKDRTAVADGSSNFSSPKELPKSYTRKSPSIAPQVFKFKDHKGSTIKLKPSVQSPVSPRHNKPQHDSLNVQTIQKASETENTTFLSKDDFQIGKNLGKGKYGDVYIVRHKGTGFICALKIIDKDIVRKEEMEVPLSREVKLSFFMSHPHVAQLYGCFQDERNVYLLLELCTQGTLYQVLKERKRLTQVQTATVINQLCKGVYYMHSQSIIHRDIKPQNIIIESGLLKLCDFGWAVFCGNKMRSTFCGTPLYVSPQVLRGDDYDDKIDIWTIGILTYELLVGRIPFRINTKQDLVKIIFQEIVFPQEASLSELAQDFVLSILKRSPQQRIGIEQVIDHPFLRQQCPSLLLFK